MTKDFHFAHEQLALTKFHAATVTLVRWYLKSGGKIHHPISSLLTWAESKIIKPHRDWEKEIAKAKRRAP